jgi:hypothetical protein
MSPSSKTLAQQRLEVFAAALGEGGMLTIPGMSVVVFSPGQPQGC